MEDVVGEGRQSVGIRLLLFIWLVIIVMSIVAGRISSVVQEVFSVKNSWRSQWDISLYSLTRVIVNRIGSVYRLWLITSVYCRYTINTDLWPLVVTLGKERTYD